MTERVRWGILSTANIAAGSFLPALAEAGGEALAVGSRSSEKAEAFAKEHGINRAYGSYEAVLEAPDIDAVYIPLPNTMHLEWIERAARAKKHVFCEKPLAMTADEARRAVAATQEAGVMLVEAFVYRFHRQSRRIREWLDSGSIGDVYHTDACFHVGFPKDPSNIRLRPEVGGGALMDLGCYTLNWTLFVMGTLPSAVSATSYFTASGVDRSTVATLRFNGERTANVSSGFGIHGGQGAKVYGSLGTLEVTRPFHPRGEEARVVLHKDGRSEQLLTGEPEHPFTESVKRFQDAVLGKASLDARITPEIVEQARTVDAVRSAAQSGSWVNP